MRFKRKKLKKWKIFLPKFNDCYLLNSKKFKIEIQTIQTFLSLIEHVSFTIFNYLKMLFAPIIKKYFTIAKQTIQIPF